MSKGAWTAIGSLIVVIIVLTIFLLSGNAERAREERSSLAASLEQKITDLGVAKDKDIAALKHQQEIDRLNAQRQQELAELAVKSQKELTDLAIEHLKELIEAQRIPRSPKSPPYRTDRTDRFRGEVYQGENFEEDIGSLAEVAAIDYYWGSKGPLGLRDHFSVRWKGSVWFEAGNYRFRVCADDGVRLYIDGRLLIDRWLLPGFKTNFETELYLTEGYHNIKLEYFEKTGQSVIRLSWQNLTYDP